MMKRTIPAVVALAILVSSGVVHGIRSRRWSSSGDFATKVAALERVPSNIGTWQGQDLPLERRVQEAAGIAGYLMRRYVDRSTGEAVTVLLVCGRPGPISVHTPEVCYEGTGYESTDSRAKLIVSDSASQASDSFWATDFQKQRAGLVDSLRIYYAWSEGAAWKASAYPRLEFGGSSGLYKLYVVRQLPPEAPGETRPPGERARDNAGLAFLKASLPVLRNALAPASDRGKTARVEPGTDSTAAGADS